MTKSGVYIITNVENNKVYIGSTKDFKRRWDGHRYNLRGGTHGNSHLQSSWNKYSESVFEFSVLEYVDNIEELVGVEQLWMDRYRREGISLYNFGIAADCPMRGRILSKETRRKMSEARIGMIFTEEHKRRISKSTKGQKNHAKAYPAFVHMETGEAIPAGFNLSALCRKLGIHRQGLNAVIHGREPSYYGWILVNND